MHYLRANVHVTTSGFLDAAALQHTIDVMGPERVLYAADYPFESFREASDWFEELTLDETVKQRIAHDNAVGLLGLDLPALRPAIRTAARVAQ